jgi:hypothetical protein
LTDTQDANGQPNLDATTAGIELIKPTTGAYSVVTDGQPLDLECHPSTGQIVMLAWEGNNTNVLYKINRTTGQMTDRFELDNTTWAIQFSCMGCDSNGNLYAIDFDDEVWKIEYGDFTSAVQLTTPISTVNQTEGITIGAYLGMTFYQGKGKIIVYSAGSPGLYSYFNLNVNTGLATLLQLHSTALQGLSSTDR